jgi:hypothetical protein
MVYMVGRVGLGSDVCVRASCMSPAPLLVPLVHVCSRTRRGRGHADPLSVLARVEGAGGLCLWWVVLLVRGRVQSGERARQSWGGERLRPSQAQDARSTGTPAGAPGARASQEKADGDRDRSPERGQERRAGESEHASARRAARPGGSARSLTPRHVAWCLTNKLLCYGLWPWRHGMYGARARAPCGVCLGPYTP